MTTLHSSYLPQSVFCGSRQEEIGQDILFNLVHSSLQWRIFGKNRREL